MNKLLPTVINVSMHVLNKAGYNINENTEDVDIGEILSDYITDKYGFLHGGFSYRKVGKRFILEDVKWDLPETIDVNYEINKENVNKALKVLIDNGIDKDEAETVLQAIGYALIDTELETLFE